MAPLATSFSTFLEMGGYAAYVWPALGLAAVVMIGCLVQSLRVLRTHEGVLAALEAERPDRGAGAKEPRRGRKERMSER